MASISVSIFVLHRHLHCIVILVLSSASLCVSRTLSLTALSTLCFLPITTSFKRSFLLFPAICGRNRVLLQRSPRRSLIATTSSFKPESLVVFAPDSSKRFITHQSNRKYTTISSNMTTENIELQAKMADLIDGNTIAAQIRVELKDNVKILQECLGATPGLAVILVGERKDSATYVRMKKKACAEVGVNSFGFDYPGDVTEAELLAKIDELNEGKKISLLISDRY